MNAGVVVVIAVVMAVVVVAGIVAVVLYAASRGRPRPWRAPHIPDEHSVVTLSLTAGAPDDPAVQRLVREAAARQFAAFAHVESVEVRRGDGTVLGVVNRSESLRSTPAIPDALRVEHAPRRRGPRVTGSSSPPHPPVEFDPSDFATSDKPFAEQFDVPDIVRERIADPTSPSDVVEAILQAAGVSYTADQGVIVAGDTAIVLLGDGTGHTVTTDQLARGFLRFEATHARAGVAICLGFVNPQELHRRELLAPTLRHAGPEAIQRMADALRLGGNPVDFAAGAGG